MKKLVLTDVYGNEFVVNNYNGNLNDPEAIIELFRKEGVAEEDMESADLYDGDKFLVGMSGIWEIFDPEED